MWKNRYHNQKDQMFAVKLCMMIIHESTEKLFNLWTHD